MHVCNIYMDVWVEVVCVGEDGDEYTLVLVEVVQCSGAVQWCSGTVVQWMRRSLVLSR